MRKKKWEGRERGGGREGGREKARERERKRGETAMDVNVTFRW